MIYTGLTFGQFVALLNFLNAYGICYHLNYWGSDYAKVQLPDIEKKGQKRFLEPDDELFLTLCRLRVNMREKVLAHNYNISVSQVSRIFATWLDKGLVAIAPNGALTFVSDLYGGHCSDSYC